MRFLSLALILFSVADVDAGGRRRGMPVYGNSFQITPGFTVQHAVLPPQSDENDAIDALDQLNAQRAARGLFPYIRDEGLTAGALHVARFRARHRCQGHTASDLGGLPVGVHAACAGCAAWPQGMGFGACAMYDTGYRYAGAATCIGADGLAYHQLFVR